MSSSVKDLTLNCLSSGPFLLKLILILDEFRRVEQQKYTDLNLNAFLGLLCHSGCLTTGIMDETGRKI